jgi:pimeloyl-ACP methyl ester carboxylesterase
LVGHSNGGRIAIKLNILENLPFNINKNILIDSAGIKAKLSFYKKLRIKLFKILKKLSTITFVKNLFPNLESDLKNKFGSSDYNNASPIMKETLVKLVNEDLTDKLNKINVPTLLIWGDKDTATPLSDAKIMNKNIKDSGLVIYENCSHFSFVENREKTILVFKSFLNIK